MNTLPRPTGKELVRGLERAGFTVERMRGSNHFMRHPDGCATVIPLRSRALGLGLLRKIVADCPFKSEHLNDLL